MQFKAGHFEKIDADYHSVLYRYKEIQTFKQEMNALKLKF